MVNKNNSMSSSHILVIIIIINLTDELMVYRKGEWSASVVLSAGLWWCFWRMPRRQTVTIVVSWAPAGDWLSSQVAKKKKNYMGIYININNIIFLAYVLSLLYSYVIFGVID